MFGHNTMFTIWLFTCIATVIVTLLIIAKWYRPKDILQEGDDQE